MSDGVKFRTCKRLTDDGTWSDVEFEDLKVGDRFRLYEDGKKISEAIADSEPKPCEPAGNFILHVSDLFKVAKDKL